MKWEGNRESDNVEDRRSEDYGGGGCGIGGRSIGSGTVAIALVASYFLGISPGTVISLLSGGQPAQVAQAPAHAPPANDEAAKFVSTVLADTEDSWTEIFRSNGANYRAPKLVLFSQRPPTACGTGQAATGPFYCPGDQKVYIDLKFFRLMRQRQSETQANAMSVRVELQADCFAGGWAYHANQARSILEAGDVETALNAATAIGDDALQKQARGYVVPDSFTHGSSAQRVRWFKRGIESGKVGACNTFEASALLYSPPLL